MIRMSAEEAQAWLARGKLVQEAEAAELRGTSMATKLQQLAALMASRDIFGAEPERELQVTEARQRWVRLRQSVARRWIREFATASSMPDMLEDFDRLIASSKS